MARSLPTPSKYGSQKPTETERPIPAAASGADDPKGADGVARESRGPTKTCGGWRRTVSRVILIVFWEKRDLSATRIETPVKEASSY